MVEAATISGHTHAVSSACYDELCNGLECDADFVLRAEAATIPGHTHSLHCDKSCSDFECDVDCMLKAEAATISGHTHAVSSTRCDELCSGRLVHCGLRVEG